MTKKIDDDELDLLSNLLLTDEDEDASLEGLNEEEELSKLQAEMDAELDFYNEKNNIVYSKQKADQKSTKDLKQNKSVLMSFEEYEAKFGPLTQNHERAIKEYKTASFPELHENIKHNDDVESKTSLLALSRPAKILSSLIQMEVEKNKNKKKNMN